MTIESPRGLALSFVGELVALSKPYSRRRALASPWLSANKAVRSRGNSREGVGGGASTISTDLRGFELTLFIGVGAGAWGNAVDGVGKVEGSIELERLIRMTGDCSGVGRGRKRGRRRAWGPGTVCRELCRRASLD